MRAGLKTSIPLGLMIVCSAAPCAAFAANASNVAQSAAHRDKTDLAKAKGLAPEYLHQQGSPDAAPEIDGLGRNDNDCVYGCLDH
jgi:hypothetical protein